MVWWIAGAVAAMFALVVLRGAPYVPSRAREVRQAFTELHPLTKKDYVVDIGSGDGVVLREARRCGARAYGIELNPLLALFSRLRSWGDTGVRVRVADYALVDVPRETTVIYTFGDGRDIAKMAAWAQKQAQRHKTKIYFITLAFEVPGHTPIKRHRAYFLYRF